MASYDASRTGRTSASPLEGVTDFWTYETDSRNDILASPVVADGTVYVGSGFKVYALSLADGTVKWVTESDYQTGYASTALYDDLLLVSCIGDEEGELLALDRENGDVVWHDPAPVSTGPTIVEETIYVGTTAEGGSLYAIDAETGDERWSTVLSSDFETAGLPSSEPAIVDGSVYVTGTAEDAGEEPRGRLLSLAEDGSIQWEHGVSGRVQSSPAVADGSVYFGTGDRDVYAIDSSNGETEWTVEVGNSVYASPALDDERLYVTTMGLGDGLLALSRSNGETVWTGDARPLYTEPAIAGERVYVGGARIQAFDTRDGDPVWEFDMDNLFSTEYTPPALVDDRVVVGTCTKEEQHQQYYDNYLCVIW